MSIKNNTTSLQELLEAVNNLPNAGSGGVDLPELTNEGSANDLMLGKELIDANGNVVSGSFTIDNELTAQDSLIAQIATALEGKAAGGEQATPVISINSSGLITATAGDKSATKQLTTQAAKTVTPNTSSQTAVASGVYTTGAITVAAVPTQTKSATPTTTSQDVTPDSGKFLSKVTVGAIPSNYIVPSGTLNITTNGTHDVKNYESATVEIAGSGGGSGEGMANTLMQLLENPVFSNDDLTEISVDLFRGWQYITKLQLPNVTKIASGYLCYSCTKLEEVYMPMCTTLGSYAFYNNTSLKNIDFPCLTIAPSSSFRQCSVATSVNLPVCTRLEAQSLYQCTKIEKMDFPMVEWLGNQVFGNCSVLTTLIFRANKVCTMSNGTNIFKDTPIASGTGYIYVPSALVDSYKTATNWSTYAAQIRAIEDYPEICG